MHMTLTRTSRIAAKLATSLLAGASLPALSALAEPPAPATVGLQQGVVFSGYSPLADTAELLRRLLSPLEAAQVRKALAGYGKPLVEQSVDLTQERFTLYVPPQTPPQGYGVLVFVPPWNDARLPAGWAAVLDQYDMIFVSAARSGNDANVLERREPLAMLGVYNVMLRYPVDRAHVYIGGFSGGARVALRLAVAYPDVFSGALLNSGSDPLGDQRPLPPKDLFQRFQENSRVVYLTGEQDPVTLSMDASSYSSLRKWCVFDLHAEVIPRTQHEVANPITFSSALRTLRVPAAPPPERLTACRTDLDKQLTRQLDKVQALIGAGKRPEALKLLTETDRHFGGLAAPRSLELQSALEHP
jgi:dienelactone hydrolase